MKGIPYYTPSSSLRGEIAGYDGMYEATIYRHGYAYRVVVIKEEATEVLVASTMFYGWISKQELIKDE